MGALGARGLRGHKRGRQKERKKERKRNRERERKKEQRGKEGKQTKNKRNREQERKNKGKSTWGEGCHAVSGASWAQGKKTSGAPNWRRKEIKTMNIFKLISFWYLNKKCRFLYLFNNNNISLLYSSSFLFFLSFIFLRFSCNPPHLSSAAL